MSQGFQELQHEELTQALESLLLPLLRNILATRSKGHCIRVADLDSHLMMVLTRSLRREVPEAQVFILNGNRQNTDNLDLYISSTKLIELRNPLPDGSLRPPLLIFLPSNLQTNAEDSFNVASFEEISLADVYQQLVQKLIQQVPTPLQGYVKEILRYLTQEKWHWANAVKQARFLQTAVINGIAGDTLGAALYELGLVPDFHLFDEPTTTTFKIRKNLESMKKLTLNFDKSILGRVLDLELADKSVQNRLNECLVEVGVEDPYLWTKQVVLNRKNWDISFDKWKFQEEVSPDKISIEVLDIGLSFVKEDETNQSLQSLIGQQVLVPKEQKKFKVEFKVDPHPQQIEGLDHFTVQIMTQDGCTVGGTKKVKALSTKKANKSATLDKLDKFEFDEGWHFVRILPWTANGDPIPLAEPDNSSSITQLKPYESELFYVLPNAEIDAEPPEIKFSEEISLEHAKLRLQFKAIAEGRDPNVVTLKDVVWAEKSSKTRSATQEALEVKFGRDGKFRIPIAQCLKDLELAILTSPQSPVGWKLQVKMGQVGSPSTDIIDFPKSAVASSFLSTRADYFADILSGDKNLISQAVNFIALKDVAYEYAAAYRELLVDLCRKVEKSNASDWQSLRDLKNVLLVDTVRLEITDFRGQTREAILLGATHPLRALWLTTWSQIAQSWVAAAYNGQEKYVGSARDGILQGFLPLNVPPTLPLTDGRVFITVDNINPFWSLYAPSTEENTRGLLGEVCAALGLTEPTIGAAVNADVLASRIESYLAQNPYIRTLSINAFNSGRATVLADALILLQKREAFRDLRYDIRLFVPDPEAPGVGEAIEQLLTPISTITSEVVDAFSTSSGNYLFPKLNLAVHSVNDFRNPESKNKYQAHISILVDLFPAKEIGSAPPFRSKEIASLHGLVQDFVVEFQDNESGTFWRRQPRHGEARSVVGAENLIDLLAELPKIMSGATATVATGVPAFENRPVVTLGLNAEQRELLHHIHNVCDWVFTIDRNIGIEFFDHGGQSDRPPYLVDYVPNTTASLGHRLVVTSRSLSELESVLSQVLEQHGLKAEGSHAGVILEQLRSLSGRLALKLISSANQQAEALGLALARLFLQYQGALSNQIILPLDAHVELFQKAKQQADELGNSVSLQRTDLALFDLNAKTRTIVCNLVEVKCYAQVGTISSFNRLKEQIAEQINQSQNVLCLHFKAQARPDILLKFREFATLLEFYLERALRYGVIEKNAAEEARILITTLEDGYTLEFTRSALVFDFEKSGTDPPESHQGIEYHRIGIDLIKELIALAKPAAIITQSSEVKDIIKESQERNVTDLIPRLISAAFIVPSRERSTTWDDLIMDEQQSVFLEEEHPETSNPVVYSSVNSYEIPSSINEEIEASALNNEETQEVQDILKCVEVINSQPPDNFALPLPLEVETDEAPKNKLVYDVMLGVKSPTPQYGILGETSGRKVALDLNQTHTISLFGVQGAGKSYTLGSIVEMACMPISNINILPSPLATVIFHYSPTQDYKPEFTSMVSPNSESAQVTLLRERFGAEPAALKDVVILVPASKTQERKAEYPNIEVLPLTFAASELKATHWRFLMGAVGSQSMYLRQVNQIMRRLREQLTLQEIIRGVESSSLSDHLKDLARTRLEFAAEYIDDSRRLTDAVRPGRLIIVDLRDEFIEKDEALGLFVVLLQILSEATHNGKLFNKLVVFDEAHKYIESPDLVAGLIEVVREMRHKGTSIMVASQDPPSVPTSLIELSSHIIMHRFNSPAWLKHIQKANVSLNSLTPENMSNLGAGEAYIWSAKASDDAFTKGTVKIRCRPRVTQHGGSTKTAVNL
ncbi:MAG: ATP-binding protein [Nostoc sp.]|uniref:methylation-associated defense system ATP-binding protein MAD8 n=1 Tax=Nostoc sp. TaxID=1180 RepID=UPI002FFB4A1D